ncbi:DUF4365 domain-containing protein [Algivirga pacifica]|uniref:DUF4365 domain-containing protein n=1 Tax=Algivirga pacifica TaxID=1162670 RepID=A0ABP9D4D6_9BACT
MNLPNRPRQHVLETESINKLRNSIPTEWVIQSLEHDYGIDNLIEIANNDGYLDGTSFAIQLKATDSLFENRDNVSVRMNTSTLNYLKNRLELVMIILYVSTEQESYWIWLRDIIGDVCFENETFTIKIPKNNRLSSINWNRIQEYSERIRNTKVSSTRGLNYRYE